MSSSAIRAGQAYVELLLQDNKFVRGLDGAGKRLRSFGAGMMAMGASIGAAGAAMLTPLIAATSNFVEVGSRMKQVADRIGTSTEALSELARAAETTGVDIDRLQEGLTEMTQRLGEAAKAGSGSAFDMLKLMGMDAEELAKAKPEDAIGRIADAINKLPSDSEKLFAIDEIFGGDGREMVGFLKLGSEGMAELRQQARDMGLVMSSDAASNAMKLGQMMNSLWKTLKNVGLTIGEALAPHLIKAGEMFQTIATAALKWIRENKQLFVTIAAVGAGLVAAGAAITAFGLGITIVGTALGGLAAAIGAVGTVLGVLLSPFGLIAAALAGGIYLWVAYTDAGKETANTLKEYFGEMFATFKQIFGGIKDALAAGDLALAGKIAMAGLRAVWSQGIEGLNAKWQEWKAFFLQVANEATSSIASYFTDAWIDVQLVWQTAKTWFLNLFTDIVTGAANAWRSAQDWVGQGLLAALNKVGALSDEELKIAQEDLTRNTSGRNSSASDEARQIKEAREQERDAKLATLEEERKQRKQIIDEERKAAAEQIEARKQAAIEAGEAEAEAAKAELDALTERAKVLADEKRRKDEEDGRKNQEAAGTNGPKMEREIFGSYSAAAIMATAAGIGLRDPDSVQKQMLREMRRQAALQDKQEEHLRKIREMEEEDRIGE